MQNKILVRGKVPVITTYELDNSSFVRRVELTKGNKEATLYVGDIPVLIIKNYGWHKEEIEDMFLRDVEE